MSVLLLIDGNSIANRAFYGIRPLTNSSGVFTHSITGFFNIYIKLIKEFNPDIICAAFDLKTPTFRKELYDGYKAGRRAMPEELAQQIPYIKNIIPLIGGNTITCDGYEADDIIGTLSSEFSKTDGKCVIYTGDRDYLQLIKENVTVVIAGNKGDTVYTPEKLKEDYGLSPLQMIELKAIQGDSSDNIPGVPGIGEKGALSLISKYKTVDFIFENLEDIEVTKSIRMKLSSGKESAYLSRKLGEIRLDTPVSIDFEEYRFNLQKTDWEQAKKIFESLEMTGTLRKIGEYLQNAGVKLSENSVSSAKNTGDFITSDEKIFGSEDSERFKNLTDISLDRETLLAAYVLDGNNNLNFPALANRYSAESPEELKSVLNERISAQDAEYLLNSVEIPLSGVLDDMSAEGIKLDCEAVSEFGEALQIKILEFEKLIHSLCGEEFNINSPKQLGEMLFDKLKIGAEKKLKRTKTGYSTDAETLEGLSYLSPIIPLVLSYRELTKLHSTYVSGLLNSVKEDGKIHTTYRQTETRTGRLSSAEPNLQNIPVRTELGKEFRKFFVAGEGNIFVGSDYSQIELRVLAHLSRDKNMTSAFKDGGDIHTLTASQVFGVFPEAVTSEMRRAAKAVNFGIVYGIGAFSLAKDISVTAAKAKEYIENYLKTYKGVAEYMELTVKNASEKGYSETMFGRRRYIPELLSTNKNILAFGRRIAQNSPVQGSAADIIKIAMVNVFNRLKKEKLKAKLILQIHDELIIECPESEAEKVSELLKFEAENAVTLLVPLTADVRTGKSWFECH